MTDVKIYKVKDGFESKIKENWLCNLPFRCALIGSSQISGKTTLLCNLLASPSFYLDYWQGDNIFIISGTKEADPKVDMVCKRLQIPPNNVTTEFSQAEINRIYNIVRERHAADPKEHFLLVLDDCAHAMSHSMGGGIRRLFFESRHYGLSIILTAQKASNIDKGVRENLSIVFTWSCSPKQADLLADDFARGITKKDFLTMLRMSTKEPRKFMVIRLGVPVDEMYLNSEFKPLLID
jgi:hypothetical protein